MSIIILLSRKSAKSNDIIDLHHPIGPNLSIRILCIIRSSLRWIRLESIRFFSIGSALNLQAIKSCLLTDPIRYDLYYHHWEEHDLIWSKLVYKSNISRARFERCPHLVRPNAWVYKILLYLCYKVVYMSAQYRFYVKVSFIILPEYFFYIFYTFFDFFHFWWLLFYGLVF